ncbi:hypothetical protein L484_026967 [Morus notabilis]|uniref:Interferon-related developmental regulator N-terminal domain-containing protein n=1 Tax=Morus notabilis TaxID=981085 RepID=W9R123_9ROSA|nr:hypothetical protein L484_026967 [Morus notabilis]
MMTTRPKALQQQQRYEREAALAEIEQSRKTLLDKLKDYKGEQLEVINEASAFAGETVERNNDLLLPPYPTRPPQSLRRDNGYLPSLHKIVRNGVTSGDATNGEKKDPHELERNKNSRGMGSFLGVAAKTVLTLVGVVSVLSLSGFGPKFSGRETPLKLLSFFNQQASEEKRSSINCPPGKILVVENGEARCLVKERVEVPFSSAAAKPDVNYGCVSIEEASTIPLDSYKGMKHYLEELLERKSVKREDALKSIIKGLTFYSNSECLLAIIIDNEDNEYEIYRELLPVLSKALKSGPKPLKELECLAITSLFGSTRSEETENAMQILWNFIQSDTNHSSDVLHAAISAWLFLVASLDGWRFSYNRWQGAISYFLNLLQNGDPSLSLIAAEGLALLFESKIIDKFSFKEQNSSTPMYTYTEETFKGVVLEKLRLALEQITHQNVADKMKVQYLRTLNYFQFNYLKSFLGDEGFYIHMKTSINKRFVFEDKHIKRISKDKIAKRKNMIKGLLDKEKTISMTKYRKSAEERKLMGLWNE